MQIKLKQAAAAVAQTIRARLVPMVVGSPGLGKSAIVHDIAKQYSLKVIDMRLAQCDPTDLMGFPTIDAGKARYMPMATFPLSTDPIPEGFNGWLLFLDEFNSAPPSVQAAAYKLVLDRMVGEFHLHEKVAIVCAGNLETDNAIVQSMSTALQTRLVHFEVAVDADEWIDWATESGIDHRITSFIKFKPGQIYTFSPTHTDKTYACPRTWEFASRFIKGQEKVERDLIPMLAGTLSEGVARELVAFCQVYQSLPTIAEITAAPDLIKVPTEPSILFAITGSIAHNAKDSNIEALMVFVSRLPIEFQVVTLREIVRRHKPLLQNSAVQQWITKNATELF